MKRKHLRTEWFERNCPPDARNAAGFRHAAERNYLNERVNNRSDQRHLQQGFIKTKKSSLKRMATASAVGGTVNSIVTGDQSCVPPGKAALVVIIFSSLALTISSVGVPPDLRFSVLSQKLKRYFLFDSTGTICRIFLTSMPV